MSIASHQDRCADGEHRFRDSWDGRRRCRCGAVEYRGFVPPDELRMRDERLLDADAERLRDEIEADA